MPGRSADSASRRMPRNSALGRDRAACPAQPGIAADRFAREIVAFWTLLPARSRQLNAKPLGGQAINVASRSDRFRFVAHAAAGGRFGRALDAWAWHPCLSGWRSTASGTGAHAGGAGAPAWGAGA